MQCTSFLFKLIFYLMSLENNSLNIALEEVLPNIHSFDDEFLLIKNKYTIDRV